MHLFAAHGGSEVAQPPAQRSPDLWESLGAKDEQCHNQDEQQVRWLQDVADEVHTGKLSWCRAASVSDS
jgi:hypothetical protein